MHLTSDDHNSNTMRDRRVRLPLSLVIVVVVAMVFVAGFGAGAFIRDSRDSSSVTSDRNVRDFLAAYQLVTQRSYFRPFDRHHLIYAAIDGMLSATGDPHTLFLSPQDNKVADRQLNGTEFSGIGAIVQPDGGNLRVVAPLPGAPASEAGIRANDLVTRIDGRRVSRMGGDEAVLRIHGKVGSTVRLTVRRHGHAVFTVTVKRAQIPPITAYGRMLDHEIGYIQIISFGDTTSTEVARAITYLRGQHARSLVLDMRDNPGGYVDAAQRVTSEFLSTGTVAYEQGPDKKVHPLPVMTGEQLTRLPVAVLMNGGTASAAEITAAALRDNHRAVLFGSRTYGKGSMQSVYALSDGSSIRITDRLWLTPDRQSIQGVGIRPDIAVSGAGAQQRTTADRPLTAAERYLVAHVRQ